MKYLLASMSLIAALVVSGGAQAGSEMKACEKVAGWK